MSSEWWRRFRSRIAIALACLVAFAGMSQLPEVGTAERMLSWTSLLPPSVALALVLVTRRVVPSLIGGILVGAVVAHGPLRGLGVGLDRYFWSQLIDPYHLYVSGFALLVLGMVRVTERSGGTQAVVDRLRGRLRTRRATRVGGGLLGLAVFFDDYANTMVVGPALRPLCDRYGISREKLAYIVDSTAAPVAGLSVVSTWLSHEVGILQQLSDQLGLEQNGYSLLLQALGGRYYCSFALALVFVTALWGREYGPMLQAERRAARQTEAERSVATEPDQVEGAPNVGRAPSTVLVEGSSPSWLWLNMVLPVGVLLSFVAGGFVVAGGGTVELGVDFAVAFDLAFWQRVISRVRHPEIVLFVAAFSSATTALILAPLSRQLSVRGTALAFRSGVETGLGALLILIGAWGLGAVCKDLGTGAFLVHSLSDRVAPLWVPLLTFGAAAAVALATGTSFGTMSILIPAAVPLAYHVGGLELCVVTIAAVLDGAIFGDHCSPLSDTTLLSATACSCDLLSHVTTQLPYALTAMVIAALGYFVTTLGDLPPLAVQLMGMTLLVFVVRVVGKPVPL